MKTKGLPLLTHYPTWTAQGKPNTDRIEALGRILNR